MSQPITPDPEQFLNRLNAAVDGYLERAQGRRPEGTKTWIAQQLGVDRTTLYKYLDGTNRPAIETLQKLARLIGLSEEEKNTLLFLGGYGVAVPVAVPPPPAEPGITPSNLREALADSLPEVQRTTQGDQLSLITGLLSDLRKGQLSQTEVAESVANSADLRQLISDLAGCAVTLRDTVIDFSQAQAGDISIGTVAGRDVYRFAGNTFNIFLGGSTPGTPVPPAAATPPPVREGVNPFVVGPAVMPEQFYGRAEQLRAIRDRIGGITPQCISIVGFRRSGKSSILRYVRERIHELCPSEQRPLIVSCSLALPRIQTPEALYEHLRRGVEAATGCSPWRREENGDPYALDDGLQALRDQGLRLIVLLDEFEAVQSRLAVFQDWGNDWRERAGVQGHFALVIASLRHLDELYTTLGLTSPFGNIFTVTELGALTEDEWQALVRDGFHSTGSRLSEHDLALIDDLAGGLPYYTQLAAQTLWSHGDHARVREEFARQAAPRFDELWGDLDANERLALRHSAGVAGLATPAAPLQTRLQRHGLLRTDGRTFSGALAAYLRGRR